MLVTGNKLDGKEKDKSLCFDSLQVPFMAKLGGLLHSSGLLTPKVKAKPTPAQDSAVLTLGAVSWILACKKGILT